MSEKDNNYAFGGKSFDITNHDWSDDTLCFNCIDGDGDLNLYCKDVDGELYINERDAIAIANHFKLIVVDLK